MYEKDTVIPKIVPTKASGWHEASGEESKSGYKSLNSYDKGFIPGYENQNDRRERNKQAEFEQWITWGGILLLGIIIFVFVKNVLINPMTKQNNYRFPDVIVRKSDNIELRLVNENSNSGTYEYKTEDSSGSITINKSDIKFQTRFYSNLETV